MARSTQKLTKRVVDTLRPAPNGRDFIYFDAEVPRFGVRVNAEGDERPGHLQFCDGWKGSTWPV